MKAIRVICWVMVLGGAGLSLQAGKAEDPQYKFEEILIPRASAEEEVRSEFSLNAAVEYLEQGAHAWSGQKKCVSCHTNGTYMQIRPALSELLGAPAVSHREFFVRQLEKLNEQPRDLLRESTRPAQVIYVAAGLAEWDARVTGQLSPETSQALELMFELQDDQGTWFSLDCWPPLESDAYHEATVALMAVSAAPDWPASIPQADKRAQIQQGLDKLRTYLRTETPPHDYSRVLLLWASARDPELLTRPQREDLTAMLWRHQQSDGSWSLRTFAAPEAWGRGNRANKLREEPEFETPPGDGHMTGLALIVLREQGTPVDDPRLQQGVRWLKQNQRASGRWWTRSLNTDRQHYITYSGTAYPLLALHLCQELKAE